MKFVLQYGFFTSNCIVPNIIELPRTIKHIHGIFDIKVNYWKLYRTEGSMLLLKGVCMTYMSNRHDKCNDKN